MSNVIKSSFIYMNKEDKKIIDSNELIERFRLINNSQQINSSVLKGEVAATEEDGFTEGLNVTVIDQITTQEQDELLKLQEEHILRKAREEADSIIEEARQSAEETSRAIYEEAKEKGYQDGYQKAMEEAARKQSELDSLIEKHNKEYEDRLKELEPKFAEIVAILVNKMTGIMAENNQDVIHHLIQNAIRNADNSKSFVIRVSEKDYEFVVSKKVEIASLVKENTSIDIVADKELTNNQCYIEVDTCIIDCSLDTQLSNLIQNLKLLSIGIEQ